MRITLTPAQYDLIESHPRIRDLTVDIRKTAVSFSVEDADDILANLAPIGGKVAANLMGKVTDALALFTPEEPSPATEPATPSPTTPVVSEPVSDPLSLPDHVLHTVADFRVGAYGTEARRLAETMDVREGERMTRWVARLRHKLTSAGLRDAADSLRLTPAII